MLAVQAVAGYAREERAQNVRQDSSFKSYLEYRLENDSEIMSTLFSRVTRHFLLLAFPTSRYWIHP